MNVIIPTAGVGQRFVDAGYNIHKSLLKFGINNINYTIMDMIISMFGVEDNIVIITNENNYNEFLYLYYKHENINIIKIPNHKQGPVVSVLNAWDDFKDILNPFDGTIISYGDFYQRYNYEDFQKWLVKEDVDGAIFSYTGYHPHLIKNENIYATSDVDNDNNVFRVKEKYFEGDKYKAHHSSGMYYFRNLQLVKKYFELTIQHNNNYNNEFYVSLVYNDMINNGLKVKSYLIDKFLQLGTPEDYEDNLKELYRVIELDKSIKSNKLLDSNHIMLMAGRSERFVQAGYTIPKPFIYINNEPIYLKLNNYLPIDSKYSRYYITADDYKDYISDQSNKHKYIFIEKNKIGPAYSYYKGAKDIKGNVLVTSCDIICNYLTNDFFRLKEDYDIIVFSTTNHDNANENPNMYSWIERDGYDVKQISLKKPLNTPVQKDDYILIGSFWIKDNQKFISVLKDFLSTQKDEIQEYYIDEAINYLIMEGYKVATCEVSGYYSLGTPQEYLKSKYWMEWYGI